MLRRCMDLASVALSLCTVRKRATSLVRHQICKQKFPDILLIVCLRVNESRKRAHILRRIRTGRVQNSSNTNAIQLGMTTELPFKCGSGLAQHRYIYCVYRDDSRTLKWMLNSSVCMALFCFSSRNMTFSFFPFALTYLCLFVCLCGGAFAIAVFKQHSISTFFYEVRKRSAATAVAATAPEEENCN